ncbi:hypothetical protein B0T21DRAFT_65017 [Apiosordaria backusii]|uniref:Zn(2)-C6 fungal-type domain-containing protein n=1 Tax=Apiosordaria backusii TaxID=314023 RepID=A0AA40AIW6_9PEZI|nr:hypothetical protein B0T21DRAFT_65017 [Apiosordaria backusii]
METRGVRSRVANACDTCKQRKIRCSGVVPCGYCVRRREPENCRYTAPRKRPTRPRPPRPDNIASSSHASHASRSPAGSISVSNNPVHQTGHSDPPVRQEHHHHRRHQATPIQPPASSHGGDHHHHHGVLEEHEDTEVPREARLLCDAQGKLIFIGDCAPLSFFQTVRRLVTTRVDAHAFAPETSGYSALENISSRPSVSSGYGALPPPVKIPVGPAVEAYLEVTMGLIDLFEDNARLERDISSWVEQQHHQDHGHQNTDLLTGAVNYLVLAIGCQKSEKANDGTAQQYFDYARDVAFASLGGNLGVASVQVFILITLYSLGACQINAAFLFFGLAARAALSIGVHRTAVNARFGPEIHRQRDRLWKSLRVVDLFLSTSMGRPPATSDVDCTVSYRAPEMGGRERFDLLNASAQIFLVIESVVVEVYSRRKISPRLTEGISTELREWSGQWLERLKEVVEGNTEGVVGAGMVNGACQVLASYYYAVILVSRPFLMVELHRRLSDGYSSPTTTSGKSKLADACIDAAILMVEPIQDLIERGLMTRRAPVIVSWLFASSLVLGVGLIGGFGRIIEKYCRAAIAALEYFAQTDTHAVQYSLIAKSLLSTALDYLEKKEIQERARRTESSSQLFGLIPRTPRGTSDNATQGSQSKLNPSTGSGENNNKPDKTYPSQDDVVFQRFGFDFESTFLGMTETPDFSVTHGFGEDADQTFGALNLFPLLDGDGHIDLASYF